MNNQNNPKKPSKKDKDKKKSETKEKTSEKYNIPEDDIGLIDNIKGNYWKYIISICSFFFLMYFQFLYSKSSRYDAKTDSDVDYWEVLGVESNANLPIINKKYRELAKIW